MFPKRSTSPSDPALGNGSLIADRSIGKDRLAGVLIDVAKNAVTYHFGTCIETRISSQGPDPTNLKLAKDLRAVSL